jgi:hypothetical protein
MVFVCCCPSIGDIELFAERLDGKFGAPRQI